MEPSTASSSPTWRNTGLSRDCGSKSHTHTRPSAASCSPGPLSRGSGPPAVSPPLSRRLGTPCSLGRLALRALCCLFLPVSPSACVRHFADLPFPLSPCPVSLRVCAWAPQPRFSLCLCLSPSLTSLSSCLCACSSISPRLSWGAPGPSPPTLSPGQLSSQARLLGGRCIF